MAESKTKAGYRLKHCRGDEEEKEKTRREH
jgi:hypothetical protein